MIILKINIEQFTNIIDNNDEFEIYTHMNPDGDAIASAFGLAVILQNIGKKTEVKCCDTFPEKFNFLIKDFKNDIVENPVLLATDISDIERLGSYANKNITVCIDHHFSNTCLIENTYLEDDAVSCSAIVFKVFTYMNIEIPEKALKLLFMGIVTDSMCFQSPSMNSEAFRVVSEIGEKIDTYDIIKRVFIGKSKTELIAEQNLLANLIYYFNDRLVIGYLDNDIISKIGRTDTNSLVPIVMEPVGTQLGIVIVWASSGKYGVSIRSDGNIDASLLAIALGGGGHKTASGALVEAHNINQIVDLVAATAKKIYSY